MKNINLDNLNSKAFKAAVLDLGLVLALSACANPTAKVLNKQKMIRDGGDQGNKSGDYSTVVYQPSDTIGNHLYQSFTSYYNQSLDLQENIGGIYPEVSDFLAEWGNYLDEDEVMDALMKLKFQTVDVIHNRDDVLAEYNYDDNTIYYAHRLFNKKPEQVKELKLHEFIHFLFQRNFYRAKGNFKHNGLSLDEGMAALLVRESDAYARTDCYEKEHYYLRVILELIGTENYMTAAGKHDLSLLKSYISQYCSSSDASNLIEDMDEAVLYYRDKGTDDDKDAWEIINKAYVNKHGFTIEESNDNVMKIYSNKLLGTTYDIEGADYYCDATSHKNYFVNKCNYISLSNSTRGDYGVVLLGDDNSKQSSSQNSK